MKVAQIKSLLARQMSTHQSTLPVLEAIIEHLAEREQSSIDMLKEGPAEQVPEASVTEAAPLGNKKKRKRWNQRNAESQPL